MKKTYGVRTAHFLAVLCLQGVVAGGASAQTPPALHDRILIEGVYTRNLGAYSEVWAHSTGAYLSYAIAFPDHNLLMFRSGFITQTLREGVTYDGASSTVIPLHIGGRYCFVGETFTPFVSFMNGFNIVFEDTNLEGTKEDRTLFKYHWQFGAGVTVNLSRAIAVDAAVHYRNSFYNTHAMMTGFEYNVGLAWNLPE